MRRPHQSSRIIFLEYAASPSPLPITSSTLNIDISVREVKLCEFCGRPFTRVRPPFAFMGQKQCPGCLVSPPPITDDDTPRFPLSYRCGVTLHD